MEKYSLDDKIKIKLGNHILKEYIVNSCIEQINSEKDIELNEKKEIFHKCIQNRGKLYDEFDNLRVKN